MKKINNKFLLLFYLVIALVFTSCEQQENVMYTSEKGFVQFATASSSAIENNETATVISVLFGGKASQNTSGITVNFEVTSSDATRYAISPANGTVEIPAGEVSAEITFTPINNLLVDGNVDIVISLSNTSSVPVGLGGEGINFSAFEMTLVDDDCPIAINDWVGTYTVFENFTGGGNAPLGLNNFFGETYQVDLVLDPTDVVGNKLILSNSPGFDTYIANGTIIAFDTCNGKISMNGGNSAEVALFRDFIWDDSSYSESKFEIQATGPLATFGPYQFTLTKQ